MECEVYGRAKQSLTRIDAIEIKISDERDGLRDGRKRERKWKTRDFDIIVRYL